MCIRRGRCCSGGSVSADPFVAVTDPGLEAFTAVVIYAAATHNWAAKSQTFSRQTFGGWTAQVNRARW